MHVFIIGAGLLGVTSAYFLASAGAQVTVVDQSNAVAAGASHANAGLIIPSSAEPLNAPGVLMQLWRCVGNDDAGVLLRAGALLPLIGWGLKFFRNTRPESVRAGMESNTRLALYSVATMRDLPDRLREHVASQRGTLTLFRDEAALEAAAARRQILEGFGLHLEKLTRDQVLRLEPALTQASPSIVGGIHHPDDAVGDALRFTETMAAAACELGVTFRMNERVVGFERAGDRVSAVHTDRRRYGADAFIVAAGCWSPIVLKTLGIPLSVRPVKGYSITVQPDQWSNGPQLPVIDAALHSVVTPLGSRLRVTGTAEFAGYDTSCSQARIAKLFSTLLSLYPGIEPHLDRTQARPWAGLRPLSADGVPFIGRTKLANLYLNTGHGHLGWTQATGSAKLIADLVCGTRPAIDAARYSPLGR